MNKIYYMFLVPCVCFISGFTYLIKSMREREDHLALLEAHKNDVSMHKMESVRMEQWREDLTTAVTCFISGLLVLLFIWIKMSLSYAEATLTRENIEARLRDALAKEKAERIAAREMQLVYQRQLTNESEN